MISPSSAETRPMSKVRWWILFIVFLGCSLNYLDRMVISILAPDLQKQFSISEKQYGYITAAFAMSYAFGQVFSGRILDKIGTRVGFALALAGWSTVSMFHAIGRGALSFGILRGLLGISESPAFPGAAKAVAEWFPKKERAFAFGFVNAGTNMGVILASALVPWLASSFGWQWAFIVTGVVGFLVLLVWVPVYKKPADHPGVSSSELAHINSDPPESEAKPSWISLLSCRQAWAFALGKFLTDAMWLFYMAWFPKYLNATYQLDIVHLGPPLITIYLICDLGSVGGGWLSSSLIKRGFSVNRARKTALLVCALGVTPIFFASHAGGKWQAVILLGFITAAHQGFSSNLFTIVSDMFPRQAVASVAGFGGMCGYFGASLFQMFVGHSVQKNHNYTIPFICAGTTYLIAVAVIHALVPKMEPAKLKESR